MLLRRIQFLPVCYLAAILLLVEGLPESPDWVSGCKSGLAVKGQYILKLANPGQLAAASLTSATAATPGVKVKRVRPIAGGRYHVVKLQGTHRASAQTLTAALGNLPGVMHAEQDRFICPLGQPGSTGGTIGLASAPSNDPGVGQQWHLSAVGATSAWASNRGHTTVRIGVLDTGFDTAHPDLQQFIPGLQANGIPGSETDANSLTDYYGHGSHVAGIVAATGNNSVGVTGVMPRATIVPCRYMMDAGWGTYSAVINCLHFFRAQQVHIINHSWGCEQGVEEADCNSQLLRDEFQMDCANGSALHIIAAGNDGVDVNENPTYPVNFNLTCFITVAAINQSYELPFWTNYGMGLVHMAAPGWDVVSTFVDGRYAGFGGTSMSAPIVSAAAGLLWSASNMQLKLPKLRNMLLTTVTPLAVLNGKVATGGFLNIRAAMNLIPGCMNSKQVAKACGLPYIAAVPAAPKPSLHCILSFTGGADGETSSYLNYRPVNLPAVRGCYQVPDLTSFWNSWQFDGRASSATLECYCTGTNTDCSLYIGGVVGTYYAMRNYAGPSQTLAFTPGMGECSLSPAGLNVQIPGTSGGCVASFNLTAPDGSVSMALSAALCLGMVHA